MPGVDLEKLLSPSLTLLQEVQSFDYPKIRLPIQTTLIWYYTYV